MLRKICLAILFAPAVAGMAYSIYNLPWIAYLFVWFAAVWYVLVSNDQ